MCILIYKNTLCFLVGSFSISLPNSCHKYYGFENALKISIQLLMCWILYFVFITIKSNSLLPFHIPPSPYFEPFMNKPVNGYILSKKCFCTLKQHATVIALLSKEYFSSFLLQQPNTPISFLLNSSKVTKASSFSAPSVFLINLTLYNDSQ